MTSDYSITVLNVNDCGDNFFLRREFFSVSISSNFAIVVTIRIRSIVTSARKYEHDNTAIPYAVRYEFYFRT